MLQCLLPYLRCLLLPYGSPVSDKGCTKINKKWCVTVILCELGFYIWALGFLYVG